MKDKNPKPNRNSYYSDNDSTVMIPNKVIIEQGSYDAVYEAVGTDSTSQLDIDFMLGNGSNNTNQKWRGENIKDILSIINNIPNLLQYFVPGFLSLMLFLKLTSKKISKLYFIIFSCVYSYIFISIIGFVNACIGTKEFLSDPLVVSALSILGGILCSLIFALAFTSPKFKKLLLKYFHRTPNDDIWLDIFDLEKGSNLKVYLKNEDYFIIGQYRLHEEKGEESWFALSGFSTYKKESNELIRSYLDTKQKDKVFVTFRLKDVEHIEVFNP